YRGLLKDSFIAGSNTTPKAATNSDLVAAIWRQVEKNRVIDPTLPDPSPAVIGYLPALDEALHVETVFNNDPSLNLAEPVTLNKVNEGSWIGNFGTTAGLEIVTENDLKGITLGYLKKNDHVISIAGFPNTTPADKLTLRMEKEKILHYIDPAAFWGMHYSAGMHVYDASFTSKKRKVSLDEIYFEVMNKYLTKNRVYLDIRSEKGYSYNFYTNYGDTTTHKNLRFKIPDDNGFRELEFGAGWPIFMYHFGRFESPNTSRFIIQLRVDDNEKPLLFFENPDLINSAPIASFIKPEKLLNGTATDWTNEISLRFKNVEDPDFANQPSIPVEPGEPGQPSTGTRVYIGNHLRIQYFRLSLNDAAHPMVFNSVFEPDRAFGGIDLLPVNTGTPFQYVTNNKRSAAYHQRYSYVAETGIFYNQQTAILYAKSLYAYQKTNDFWPKLDIVTPENPLIISPLFPKEIVFEKWRVKNIPAGQEMDTVKIAATLKKFPKQKEDHFFLGLSRTELETLRATTGFHPAHTRYLVFESTVVPFQDSTNIAYRAYSIKVMGYVTDGASIVKMAPATPVIVYTMDDRLYFSNAFVALADIPFTFPDPGIVKDFGYRGPIQYGSRTEEAAIRDRIYLAKEGTGKLINSDVTNYIYGALFMPDPLPVSPALLPLVMIVHGNGHRVPLYYDLAKHLSGNGFVVAIANCLQNKEYEATLRDGKYYFTSEASDFYYDNADQLIYFVNPETQVGEKVSDVKGRRNGHKIIANEMDNLCALGRRNVIAEHLKFLKNSPHASRIQFSNIGVIGHSRGGEAVAAVAALPTPEMPPLVLPDQCEIKSIISLAPTDNYEKFDLLKSIPYFVLYGSRDEDVRGYDQQRDGRTSGFSLYDRTYSSEKSMAFVYGATHNGFVRTLSGEGLDKFIKKLKDKHDYNDDQIRKDFLPEATQQNIAKGYMNAFLRMTLKNERFWQPLFTGEQKPKSLSQGSHKGIYFQYQAHPDQAAMIDDFEVATAPENDWRNSTSGGEVRSNAGVEEKEMMKLDDDTPHITRGLKIKWKSNQELTFSIPDMHKNVAAYKFISFRIGRVMKKKQQLEDLRISL
ncbi:MAG TPA: hypothetical protein VF008_20995, partial [Niastella sp.]